MQIYPNSILQDAQIDLGTVQKQVTILLFNSYGQVMQTQHFANTRIVPFTRASLANGVYTVQIQFSDGSKLSRKISLID